MSKTINHRNQPSVKAGQLHFLFLTVFFLVLAVPDDVRPQAAWPPNPAKWDSTTITPAGQDSTFNRAVTGAHDVNRWHTGLHTFVVYGQSVSVDCNSVYNRTVQSFSTNTYWMASLIPSWPNQNVIGEIFQGGHIIIAFGQPQASIEGTIVHESMHAAGILNEATAEASLQCLRGAIEEEEDEEEDEGDNGENNDNDGNNGGRGGGGNNNNGGYTCDCGDAGSGWWWYYENWNSANNTHTFTLSHVDLGDVVVVCDYDADDDTWPDCPDIDEVNGN